MVNGMTDRKHWQQQAKATIMVNGNGNGNRKESNNQPNDGAAWVSWLTAPVNRMAMVNGNRGGSGNRLRSMVGNSKDSELPLFRSLEFDFMSFRWNGNESNKRQRQRKWQKRRINSSKQQSTK
jgi:hypothetical protein